MHCSGCERTRRAIEAFGRSRHPSASLADWSRPSSPASCSSSLADRRRRRRANGRHESETPDRTGAKPDAAATAMRGSPDCRSEEFRLLRWLEHSTATVHEPIARRCHSCESAHRFRHPESADGGRESVRPPSGTRAHAARRLIHLPSSAKCENTHIRAGPSTRLSAVENHLATSRTVRCSHPKSDAGRCARRYD